MSDFNQHNQIRPDRSFNSDRQQSARPEENNMLIPVGILHGAFFFAGIGLCLSLFLPQLNWGFLISLTIIGTIVGAGFGLFMQSVASSQIWAIPVGSLLVATVVSGLFMAFDYFIGPNTIHWQASLSLALLSTMPGLFIGWILAQQLDGKIESRPVSRSDREDLYFPVNSSDSQRRPRAAPAVPMGTDYNGSDRLEQYLQREIVGLPPIFQATQIRPINNMGGAMCLMTRLQTRQGMLQLYISCDPDYPNSPPYVQIENITAGVELLTPVLGMLNNWHPNCKISDITHEIARLYQ